MTSSLEEVGNSGTVESRRRRRPTAEGSAVVLGGSSWGCGGEGEGEWEARLVKGKGAMGGKGSEAWEGTSRRRRPGRREETGRHARGPERSYAVLGGPN